MKRLRLERWSGQLLSPRTRPCCLPQRQQQAQNIASIRRTQSTSAAMDLTFEDGDLEETTPPSSSRRPENMKSRHSPDPARASKSSKLAALHARLALPKKLPLETMARTLVDPSADPEPGFNNATLSQVGGPILSYHVSEWLLCHYPRLPMTVLFAAAYAYNGPKTLQIIAKEWGVETAFAPGNEVDPGLLQFSKMKPGTLLPSGGGSTRPDGKDYRRGISSRNVYDDEFGDLVPKDGVVPQEIPTETAYSNFVKALVGSIYLHAGRTAAKTFVKHHVLSRHLQISTLFRFDNPVRELSRLCAREDFEYPVARILSETGRHSRTPVFLVGIFSGSEKLGEGSGANLMEARTRASIAALKAWYLYSPGNDVRVPSDMEEPGAKPWEPVHMDLGEIIH